VTGGDSVTVTDVLLVEASGSDVVNGTIKAVGATDFLVNVDRIPEGAFVVQLKGLVNDSLSTSRFQRQSPTQYKGSRTTITVRNIYEKMLVTNTYCCNLHAIIKQ